MRLPAFRYRAPRTVQEAAHILHGEGNEAMLLAGGTNLLPNMKRRVQVPRTLVGLRQVTELKEIRRHAGGALSLGACLTIADITRQADIRQRYPALWQAASQIATPHVRNVGTLGGNLCLDTRCYCYDQSYDWRKAVDFCMKKDGDACRATPGSAKCLAVSSTDSAPALLALGARVRLVSGAQEREIPLADLYQDDGRNHLTRRPDEVLTEVLLDPNEGSKSAYWKVHRRGAYDFPVLSVAVAGRLATNGIVEEVHLVVGSVASCPLEAKEAETFLALTTLDDETIEEAAVLAARVAKPVDNTDFSPGWRKKVARQFVSYALRELRGDDMRVTRKRYGQSCL